jgi:Tfp pilus assembly protein PilF/TolB-like protein
MPFENTSTAASGIDWIGEAFPEVMGSRLSSSSLVVISRNDRLMAFDRLGLPAAAKPSRATIYQVARELDADYVLMGEYRLDDRTLTVRAHVMDLARLRLGSELSESGPLTSLINIQTALAWDTLSALKIGTSGGDEQKAQFVARFPPIRLDTLESYVRGVVAADDQERIKHFKEAVRLDPSHGAALLQLGKTYYRARDYLTAMSWLAKVPAGDPAANEAQFFLGLSAFYAGQMDKADSAFMALSSRLPLPEVFNNLGVTAARLGDRRARGYFEKSVQGDPNDTDYHFNLAVELLRQGQPQEASKELRTVMTLQPEAEARNFLEAISSGAPASRLPLQRIKRNYDESSSRQPALETQNNSESRLHKSDTASHVTLHIQRGEELLNQGSVAEAEKQFLEALALDPNDAGAHGGLARVMESKQDKAGARKEAQAALHLAPSANAYLVLARLDLAENNTVSAAQNVERALALDPANAAAVALKHDMAAGSAAKPGPR